MTTTTQPTISDGLNLGAMADEILAARRRRLTAAHVASRLGDGGLVGGDPLFDLLDSLDESRVILEKAVVALLEQVEVLGRVVGHVGAPESSAIGVTEGSDVEGSVSADSSTSRGSWDVASLLAAQRETNALLRQVGDHVSTLVAAQSVNLKVSNKAPRNRKRG